MFPLHPLIKASLLFFGLLILLTILLRTTKMGERMMQQEGVIGIIRVQGTIVESEKIVKQIQRMESLEVVKAVILRVNSPGGGVAMSQEIYDALWQLKQKKTVYTSMASVAASGAYYIACATDRIYANPGTITGSIGALIEWVNLEGLSQKIGIEAQVVKSGENKDLISPTRKPNPAGRALLEKMVLDTHEQFLQAILAGRPELEEEKLRELADGRIFTGKQAQELGLVDELLSFQNVIEALVKEEQLEGTVELLDFSESDLSAANLFGWFKKTWSLAWEENTIQLNYILK